MDTHTNSVHADGVLAMCALLTYLSNWLTIWLSKFTLDVALNWESLISPESDCCIIWEWDTLAWLALT
jgi:hypothetical protein